MKKNKVEASTDSNDGSVFEKQKNRKFTSKESKKRSERNKNRKLKEEREMW